MSSRLVEGPGVEDGPGMDEEGEEGVGEILRFLFDTLAMAFELANFD